MKKTSVPPIGGCVAVAHCVALCLALLFAGGVAADEIVPTPRAIALPATATNRPYLAAAMAQEPVNLATRGYVEEEFLLSGNANVYDWVAAAGTAGSAVQVRRPHLPYTTRVLLRRPLDAKRFSGRVIVEMLDDAGQGESAPLWGLSQEHFLRQGDAWIGLTLRPDALATLRRFDPLRYAKVGFAPRAAGDCTAAAAAAAAAPATAGAAQAEAGLAWDVVAQLGALLRSSSKENPLAAFTLKRVIAAGYSQSGTDLVTYINALHAPLRLGGGGPVFDGYLVAAPAVAAAPLNACAVALPADDPRRRIGVRDVPVVAVLTQTDVDRVPALRRPDGDVPANYRGYEIAGAAHAGPYPAGLSTATDLAIAGLAAAPAPAEICNEAPGNFPAGLAFNAIWMQFDDLLARGMPMQNATPLQTDAAGRPALDAQGNALGGLRLPQIAVPVAAYTGHSTPKRAAPDNQRVCGVTGSMRRLDSAELKALYGSRAEYLRRYNAAVDQAVADRWLVPADAAAVKSLAARTPLSF
ncbi:MAG TPA: alpha/beta hydrolase domain-containing protein [Steroidobacteraceae bacterium]|nr:alpha/beta hydrolase domain-containing protein [Steroidobacteraceae bacterium]